MEPLLFVISSWVIKRVYTIFISNTISGSSNIDNCFYHCLILTLISHLKVLFNSLFYYYYYYYYYYIYILFVIYIVDLLVDRPRSCRVIYYFDTSVLGIRHQLFDRVNNIAKKHNFLHAKGTLLRLAYNFSLRNTLSTLRKWLRCSVKFLQ